VLSAIYSGPGEFERIGADIVRISPYSSTSSSSSSSSSSSTSQIKFALTFQLPDDYPGSSLLPPLCSLSCKGMNRKDAVGLTARLGEKAAKLVGE
jgi:hypothetical protein